MFPPGPEFLFRVCCGLTADDGDGEAVTVDEADRYRPDDCVERPAGVTDDHPWERRARSDASRYDGIASGTPHVPDGTRSGRTKVLPLIRPPIPRSRPDRTGPHHGRRRFPVTAGTGSWDLCPGGLMGRTRPVAGRRATRSATLLDQPAGATRPVPSTVSTPIRSHVQALVERAWVAAVESGALPPLPAEASRRRRSRSRAPATPSTATSRPTWRSSSRGPCAARRWPSRRRSPRRSGAWTAARRSPRRGRGAGLPQPPAGASGVAAPRRARRAGPTFGSCVAATRARSTSSSSPPTRPARCTWATPAARSSATCCAASSRPAGTRSRASTTSTTSGARSRVLGASVAALRAGEPLPEDGYHGDYVDELAAELPDDVWAARAAEAGADAAGSSATGRRSASAPASRPPREPGRPLRRLEERGLAARRGLGRARRRAAARAAATSTSRTARLWFRSTDFGDDKDRVVIRSNGEPTYFASDIGYVGEKFSRGFDELIYIWGADHHGTVARLTQRRPGAGLRPRRGRHAADRLGALRARRRRRCR